MGIVLLRQRRSVDGNYKIWRSFQNLFFSGFNHLSVPTARVGISDRMCADIKNTTMFQEPFFGEVLWQKARWHQTYNNVLETCFQQRARWPEKHNTFRESFFGRVRTDTKNNNLPGTVSLATACWFKKCDNFLEAFSDRLPGHTKYVNFAETVCWPSARWHLKDKNVIETYDGRKHRH